MNAPIAPTPAAAPPSRDDKILAAVAHGATFIDGGLIGPAIIYFLKKDESPFVAFHALQSLYFGLLFVGIALVTCGIGVILFTLPYAVFEIIATVRAYEGEMYELPIVGRHARRSVYGG